MIDILHSIFEARATDKPKVLFVARKEGDSKQVSEKELKKVREIIEQYLEVVNLKPVEELVITYFDRSADGKTCNVSVNYTFGILDFWRRASFVINLVEDKVEVFWEGRARPSQQI